MNMRKCIYQAVIASVLVAVPIAFIPMAIVYGDSLDIIMHTGFWVFYVKGFFWLFLSSFLASILTVQMSSIE